MYRTQRAETPYVSYHHSLSSQKEDIGVDSELEHK